MHEIIQWLLVGLVLFGSITIWRLDRSTRAAERIQQAARRNVAEHSRAISNVKKLGADLGQLNQERAALNARYDDTITRIRDLFGIKEES